MLVRWGKPEMTAAMSIKEQKAPAVITLDIAPTLIDIAGLNHLDYGMDGISWWSNLLQSRQNTSLNNTQPAVEQEPEYLSRHFLIEYHGEGTYIILITYLGILEMGIFDKYLLILLKFVNLPLLIQVVQYRECTIVFLKYLLRWKW